MRTSQTALQTVGNNLANVNTPGYSRQIVDLADRRPQTINGLSIGQGVEVAQIRRLRDASVESVLLQSTAEQGQTTAELDTLRQIESLLTPGQGTLHAQVQDFFSRWELLAAEPAEGVRRQEVLQSAGQIASEINALSQSLESLRLGLQTEIETAVSEVNSLSQTVASLNTEIQIAQIQGTTPNDLLDRRDQFVTRLSELIDAEVVKAGASDGIRLANGESFITTSAKDLTVRFDVAEGAQIFAAGTADPVRLTSGRLKGLVDGFNTFVTNVEDQLAEFTNSLLRTVNAIHASGLGAGGGVTEFKSTRPVVPTNVALTFANADFPITDGELFIGVTDRATGDRTLYRVPVNPSADSLDSLTATLDAISGISASVDGTTGQLRVDANAGYAFDFTGALPTEVTVAAATGTSVPTLSGQYLGANNDQWTLTVVGSGEVGVDTGILLEVRDQEGLLIDSVPVGVGYAPGDELQLPDGVILRVPAGTLNSGDTFGIPLAADSDTSGVLAAIGAFDLFTGTRPGAIEVNPSLLKDPERLSVSQTGQPGDNRVAAKLAALGKELVLSVGSATFTEFLSLASAQSGSQVAQATDELAGLSQLNEFYAEQREALSGVNPDEELVRMLEFQRMYQAAAQLLTTVNDTLDVLFGIFR